VCGRFVSTSPPDEIAKYFGAAEVDERLEGPNFNVAPTQDVYAVLENGGVRRVEALHWGLIPFWAKEAKVGNRMINARSDKVATSGAYKHAFKKRRCIIPADGFYEWTKREGQSKKQPYFIHRPDDEPIAFAGLWEVWRPDGSEDELVSCTIITGEPNDKMAEIHDRMPVMLPPDAWDTWLDQEVQDTGLLGKFLVPAPSSLITFHPVSTEVNNVRNQGEHLLEPVELDDDPVAETG
jgi:putative SOS response-associated peptidase YedK